MLVHTRDGSNQVNSFEEIVTRKCSENEVLEGERYKDDYASKSYFYTPDVIKSEEPHLSTMAVNLNCFDENISIQGGTDTIK